MNAFVRPWKKKIQIASKLKCPHILTEALNYPTTFDKKRQHSMDKSMRGKKKKNFPGTRAGLHEPPHESAA